MYQLARELTTKGMRVITTTTTKIFPPHASESPRLIIAENEEHLLKKTREALQSENQVTVAEKNVGPKLKGLSPALIDTISEQEIADVILIEADGAKHCPLKAPNETEPVIPSSTTWTLVVVGLDGIGKKNIQEHVFRPEYFSRLAGIKEGETITPDAVARVIFHPEGLVRSTPKDTGIIIILNQGEIAKGLDAGRELAQFIMQTQNNAIAKVLITSLIPVSQVMMVFGAKSEK